MAQIRWEDRDQGRWIHLTGELDHRGYEEVTAAFHDAVAGALGTVVVDMTGVRFAGSLATRMLIRANSDCRRRKLPFFLAGLTEHVRKLLDTVGVLDLIALWEARAAGRPD